MKTLLITTLTTALLSFNSFADNTTDIKNMASLMAKEGLHQLNEQLSINSKATAQQYLNTFDLATNSNYSMLITKVAHKNRVHEKNTIQAAEE
jgi:hypothetical protein